MLRHVFLGAAVLTPSAPSPSHQAGLAGMTSWAVQPRCGGARRGQEIQSAALSKRDAWSPVAHLRRGVATAGRITSPSMELPTSLHVSAADPAAITPRDAAWLV